MKILPHPDSSESPTCFDTMNFIYFYDCSKGDNVSTYLDRAH